MTTKDVIDTRINPFCFGDTDLEADQQLQAQLDLILSGTASPSLADAPKSLETKMALPTAESSTRNIQRLKIWALT